MFFCSTCDSWVRKQHPIHGIDRNRRVETFMTPEGNRGNFFLPKTPSSAIDFDTLRFEIEGLHIKIDAHSNGVAVDFGTSPVPSGQVAPPTMPTSPSANFRPNPPPPSPDATKTSSNSRGASVDPDLGMTDTEAAKEFAKELAASFVEGCEENRAHQRCYAKNPVCVARMRDTANEVRYNDLNASVERLRMPTGRLSLRERRRVKLIVCTRL